MKANGANDIDLSSLHNRNILIIDDNKSIHNDYWSVLSPDNSTDSENSLDEMEDMLFSGGQKSAAVKGKQKQKNFAITSAYQGEEAYNLIKENNKRNLHYPVAFVDMRMPPGWDGLETIEKIREVDQNMMFMIVTAYSDHTFESIAERLGPAVPVRIIYKPFDPKEIYMAAYNMVTRWNDLNPIDH